AEALFRRFIEMADAARDRAIPLHAATFVLGAALLALAARGLAGKSNTRSALIQVVTAQAIIVVASHFALRDVHEAEFDWHLERAVIREREVVSPERMAEAAPARRILHRWGPQGWLVFRTVASALIVVALTRQRARDFFDAAAGTVPNS